MSASPLVVAPSAASHIARDTRIAGIAALVAGLGFVPQPFLIFVMPAPDGSEFWAPDRLGELALPTTIKALTWGVTAAALIVLAVAGSRLVGSGVWARVGTTFGIIGGAAWLLESASRTAVLSPPIAHFADAPVSAATQGSILYLLNLTTFGFTALGAIGAGVWLVMFGTVGQSLAGKVIRILAIIVGVVAVVGPYAFPTAPVGFLALYLMLIAVGIAILVRGRRTARDGV